MSLFVCSKCGCIDNTATSCYWALIRPCKNRIYDKSLKGYEGKPLCSECAAIEYSKGDEVVVVPGTWHGKVVEVVYERKEIDLGLDKDNFLSIDLGLNNLCSCISNVGLIPFIVNGRIMKSFNQWYNKKKAKLMSFVGDRGSSNRIRRITLFRNCWIEDKLHKISRYIVNFCRSNNIGTIIIGLNKEWKQEINIGRRNNQHFVSIPHSKLIDKIVYKAKLLGINVVIHEESYTSKIDHLAFEPLKKQESYLGKRKKRGLFQSSIGKLINADINGSIGIARKVIGDSFIGKIIDSGFVFNPIRVNTL